MSMSWGGHRNGQIPASAMITVRGEGFERGAGQQVILLGAAFKKRFNKDLIINDGYRSLSEQVSNWNKWIAYRQYLNGGPWAPWAAQAAYPGTSNHGWGKASDFGSWVQYFGTEEKKWMDKNAPKYGWYPTGNEFSRPEAWHFDYLGNPAIVAGEDFDIIEEEIVEKDEEIMLRFKAKNYYVAGINDVETVTKAEAVALTHATPGGEKFAVVSSEEARLVIDGIHRRESRRLRRIAAIVGKVDLQPVLDALDAEFNQMCAKETGFSEQDAEAERNLDLPSI